VFIRVYLWFQALKSKLAKVRFVNTNKDDDLQKLDEFFKSIGANPVVLALSLGRLGDGIGNSIPFIILPLYIDKLPAAGLNLPDTTKVGIALSLFGLTAGIVQPFTGTLSDRLNARKVFVVTGLFVLGFATLGFAFSRSYIHVLIFRILQGLGLAITIPATVAILANVSERQTRGGSMGVFSSFRIAGLAIGPIIGGFLVNYGFNLTFFVGAAFIFLGVLVVIRIVPEVKAETIDNDPKTFVLFDRSLLSASILSLGLATFVMAASFTMVVPLENQMNARLNQTAAGFGIAFSALIIARFFLQVPFGRLSDRMGRKPFIVWGLALMALSTLATGYLTTQWEFILVRIIQGIASAGIAAPVFALAGDLSRAGGEGRQMSIITMGFTFGAALGTLVAGILANLFFALPFIVGGAASIIAALVVVYFVQETRAPQGAEAN
jgi:MFS family permease